MKRIALIGVNYTASLAMDILLAQDHAYAFSFFDDDVKKLGQRFFETKVEGNTKDFLSRMNEWDGALLCIGEKHLVAKATMGKRLEEAGIVVMNAISEHCNIASSAQMKNGNIISAGVYLGQRASVGSHCIVWSNAIIEHDAVLSDACYIGPGAVLSGCVQVGASTLIGSNATILPEVKIGNGCKIGAGAVVTKDVPEGATVAGVPAKIISL